MHGVDLMRVWERIWRYILFEFRARKCFLAQLLALKFLDLRSEWHVRNWEVTT